jgi:hypothetical protein
MIERDCCGKWMTYIYHHGATEFTKIEQIYLLEKRRCLKPFAINNYQYSYSPRNRERSKKRNFFFFCFYS